VNSRAPEDAKRRKDWFSRPRQVGDALRRLAPALRKVGLEVIFRREPNTGRRLIDITISEDGGHDPSRVSLSSRTPDSRADSGDVAGNGVRHRDDDRDNASPTTPNVSGLRDARDARDAHNPLPSATARHRDDTLELTKSLAITDSDDGLTLGGRDRRSDGVSDERF
jgi:hypothetical protein